jgi:hypothetical protein
MAKQLDLRASSRQKFSKHILWYSSGYRDEESIAKVMRSHRRAE